MPFIAKPARCLKESSVFDLILRRTLSLIQDMLRHPYLLQILATKLLGCWTLALLHQCKVLSINNKRKAHKPVTQSSLIIIVFTVKCDVVQSTMFTKPYENIPRHSQHSEVLVFLHDGAHSTPFGLRGCKSRSCLQEGHCKCCTYKLINTAEYSKYVHL